MIEEIQETQTSVPAESSSAPRYSFPKIRARRLSAIEIAEGALLADIGVVFQLLIKFLPIGGDFLRLLIPVVFAVIVLRRGLYVGCMSLCVALFLICIVLGPGGAPFLLLETSAGLFLGATMRYRLSHFVTLVVGILCGGLGLWAVILLYAFIGGGPYLIVRLLRQTYASLEPLIGLTFKLAGLGSFWQHTIFPHLDSFMQWGLQNWLLLFYLATCAACIPVVIAVYLITNTFLRLLGYQVRPFPGSQLKGWLYGLVLGFFKLLPRRAFKRVPSLYYLKREVRRLNMARLRQRRLEKEGKKLA